MNAYSSFTPPGAFGLLGSMKRIASKSRLWKAAIAPPLIIFFLVLVASYMTDEGPTQAPFVYNRY